MKGKAVTMPALETLGGAGEYDYQGKINRNFSSIRSFVNGLEASVLAASADGQALILDMWDRDGIVGSQSYQLDLDTYAGGSSIVIGRRPAYKAALGEQDKSVAFVTSMGTKTRCELNGDLTLDFSTIVSGLPRSVYIIIPASGTPEVSDTAGLPNVIYAYSMTWDGFNLSDFKRMAPILPAYPTVQAILGAPRKDGVFDNETDFATDEEGSTEIVLLGAADDNEIEVDGSVEVVGCFAHATKAGAGAWAISSPGTQEEQTVKFNIESEGVTWNDGEFEFDAGNIPDYQFREIESGIGDDKFCLTSRTFRLVRTAVGDHVASARCLYWGLIVRPIIGMPCARDGSKVTLI